MKTRVFVDGQEGTTGLRIHEMLARRSDVEVLRIDADKRKDPAERARLLNAADVAFLCLPDAAAREAVALVTNPATCVIDASTAHRTLPGWAFGLPELAPGQRAQLRAAKRIANPGCHATAFILALRPLVEAGLLRVEPQGRHRYHRLASADVAQLLESLLRLAVRGEEADLVASTSLRNRIIYGTLLGLFYVALGIGVVMTGRTLYREAQISRLKTDFVSVVSHELRTPLTSVLGFAKLTKNKLEQSIFSHVPAADSKAELSFYDWKQLQAFVLD